MSRCLIVGDQYIDVPIIKILDTIKSELGGSKLSYYKHPPYGYDIDAMSPFLSSSPQPSQEAWALPR